MKKSNLKSLIVILLLAFITLFGSFKLFSLSKENNETLGQFGDFYGGILGTIITFAGLYFIYQTYKTQDEQLKIAKYDADLEIINKLYSDLIQEINSIQYRKARNEEGKFLIKEELYQGFDALYNFDKSHWNNPNSVINHLNSVVLSFEQLLMMTNKVKYKYFDMKDIMLAKVYFLFYAKIIWPVYSIYDNKKEYGLGEDNQDATLFFKAYEKLTKESINYLVNKNLIIFPKNDKIAKLVKSKPIA